MRDLLIDIWAKPERPPALSLRSWETLLAQAWQSGLIARLATHLTDRGWMHDVPARPRAYLEGALRAAERQVQEVRWEVECIRRALAPIDTPVILLKGAAYVLAQLPAARGRLFSDVDFMVPRERLHEVENALFRSGWYIEGGDPYNQRYYRQWMHELPPMKHARRGSAIDVHHTITPPTSHFSVDGRRLLAHCRALEGGGRLQVLAPPDMVLHSAVHLFQEGEFDHGLRDLLDMNDLLQHFGSDPGFWSGLAQRADELGLGVPLYYATDQVRRLFHTAMPGPFVAAVAQMRPPWTHRLLMERLLSTALYPDHPSCDGPFTASARWLLYVRAHYLRMPLWRVVPHLIRKAWMRQFPRAPAGH